VLLIGLPGAGKGTQAVRIAAHFDLARIAPGDLLRQEVASGSELGRTAKAYMDRGDLVPDEETVRHRLTCSAARPTRWWTTTGAAGSWSASTPWAGRRHHRADPRPAALVHVQALTVGADRLEWAFGEAGG
jgi:Adenylate kinase